MHGYSERLSDYTNWSGEYGIETDVETHDGAVLSVGPILDDVIQSASTSPLASTSTVVLLIRCADPSWDQSA